MTGFDDSIVQEYLAECREHLSGIEADLLAIEQDGAEIDDEHVNRVFRAAHSIKGGAGFFNFSRIRDLAHKTENVLDLVRCRRAPVVPATVNTLLQAFDRLRGMIEDPAVGEEADISDCLRSLEALAVSDLPAGEEHTANRRIAISAPGKATRATLTEFDFQAARQKGRCVYLLEYDLLHDIHRQSKKPLHVLKNLMEYGSLLDSTFHVDRVGTLDDEPAKVLPLDVLYATSLDTDLIGAITGVPLARIWKVDRTGAARRLEAGQECGSPADPPVQPQPAEAKSVRDDHPTVGWTANSGDSTVRLNVAVLDSLMNMAGELVLCRNQLTEAVARADEATIQAASQSISAVTSEVQQAVMRTRMQPVANLFQKFTRFVRDTGRKLGKDVRLVIEANEVELDKTIIEGLSDPLSHMVRNAIDHGIEPRARREASGKPVEGTVFLRAWHEAGLVVVEVADDGRGLDPEALAASAVAKGMMTAEAARELTDEKKFEIIFLPGFSTAERVTDLSGRGVGMDVVKTNLDALGGKLEIHSTPGRGAAFRIKLPLTLAIIPSLLVSAQEERVAVPLVNVQKLIRVSASDVAQMIERVGNAQVLVQGDALVPLIDLRRSLDLREPESPGGGRAEAVNIVLVAGGGYRYGLVVERLHDTIEIVVKPLSQRLKHLRQYAGATILGDGCVALILDVAGVASAAGLAPDHGSEPSAEPAGIGAAEFHHLLLVQNAPNETCALPLHLVERVEKIRPEQVELVGGRRSMQYRGRSLPLMVLGDAARVGELPIDDNLIVVVLEISGKTGGLLASRPVDVVEAELEIDGSTLRQPGIMGSAVLRGRTTLLVDVFELADAAIPAWKAGREPERPAARENHTVLIAEDSEFFREHTAGLLEGLGYRVLKAHDGQEAWSILNQHLSEVRLVLTDVEMPRLNGLQLTQKIRADHRIAHLPVVMFTSLSSEDDVRRGEAAGATAYCVKVDRDQVLQTIRDLLATPAAKSPGLAELARRVGDTAGVSPGLLCPVLEGESQ